MHISVAGIGASAGGLEAFKLLLAHLPAKTGLAFVFVQHLDPTHQSNLTQILDGVSTVPVLQAADGMEIEPDHLYVIPPDAGLEVVDQRLIITPRAPAHAGPHMPIDRFLRSLAQECGSRSIGVILSGTGTDGTAGFEALKAAGGVTFAQDPATAKFDGMPQAAIGSGCVDFVLAPEAIAAELAKLARHPYLAEDEAATAGSAEVWKGRFDPILSLLTNATGVEFALYRETTIQRRILRRLALCNIDSLEEYHDYLRSNAAERDALHRDLLINVTRFFRDPASFENLKTHVFPLLVEGRGADDALRIWVPGCATGEEAYSIAILLHEYFQEIGRVLPVQIFATDINAAVIEKARSGKYTESVAGDLNPERLNRYFSKGERGYQISRAVRDMCVFSKHDLLRDPPFSRLDLISCRNVLIYFGPVRKSIISIFHYALNPHGVLVLGSSERESGDQFSILAGAQSIYTKNEAAAGLRRLPFTATRPTATGQESVVPLRTRAGDNANETGLRRELERALLSRYGGAGVLVTKSLEVLELIGQTAPYLTLPPGKPRLNLLKLIPDTRLFLEVERLIHVVEDSGEPAWRNRVRHHTNGVAGEVNVEVIPLGVKPIKTLLVLFELPATSPDPEQDLHTDPRDLENARLKQDLADLQQRLLSIIDQRHASAEESQNEVADVLSTNEELRSLNEELETAKEELQSINEELTTVNQELRTVNQALVEARDLASRILKMGDTPLLVLDSELRIVTANPAFYRVFHVSAKEAEGHFLFTISSGSWNIPRLRELLERVLPNRKVVQGFEFERNFPGVGPKNLVLNARQLDTMQQILVGIEDVTAATERAGAALIESEARFRRMADNLPVLIWVSGPDHGSTFFNKPWLRFTGRSLQQEIDEGWVQSMHPEDVDRCLEICWSAFHARRSFQMEFRLRRSDGEYRWMLDSGIPRFEDDGAFAGYIGSCIDITDIQMTRAADFAKQKLETVGLLAVGIAHDFNNLLGSILANSELALAELGTESSGVEELGRIRVASIRGAEIVRQLMIYSGQDSEEPELVNVGELVAGMVELLQISVSKHVKLETNLDRNLPQVRASRPQIQQIAMNLITNASEAIGDQDGLIRVAAGRVTVDRDSPQATSGLLAEGEYLQLKISDTGPGMTTAVQARVFDLFFTTKPTGSHGQGLAVVQRIVRNLRGTIQIVSEPGKGSTFCILLPAEVNMVEATAMSSPTAEGATRKITILVVDDEQLLRQAVSKMLRKREWTVIEAGDGSGALKVIREQKDQIDVLLLDITLPGASSREVYEEAKRRRPGMATIVTSAKTVDMAAASLSTSVEYFLQKPFRLEELLRVIREAIPDENVGAATNVSL